MAKGRKPRALRFNVYRSRDAEPPRTPTGELLLEVFSDHDLLAWRAQGEDIQKYHYLWYYELEASARAYRRKYWRRSAQYPASRLTSRVGDVQ